MLNEPTFTFGGFTFTPSSCKLRHAKGETRLRGELCTILHTLALAKRELPDGEVVIKEELYRGICKRAKHPPEPKIVDVQITYLRQRLDALADQGGGHIINVWGVGYFLSDEPQPVEVVRKRPRGKANIGLTERLEKIYRGEE